PPVDTPPTLESILNETDDEDEPFIPEDPALLNIEAVDAYSCDTSSLASSTVVIVHTECRRRKLQDSFSRHGSVIHRSYSRESLHRFFSATDKVDAGLPTAIVSIL
ncbi:hypothetical protein GDO86_019372, partial [Hymenochirus boettgeri]